MNFNRSSHFLLSSAAFASSFLLPWGALQAVTGGIFVVNLLERLDFIEISLHPEVAQRKTHMVELLRHHLLKSDELARWVKDDTLMVAKPFTRFDDQGFLGWIALRLNLNIYKTQNFTMEVPWKDVKYYGEGIAYCEGKFTNMQNYYFSKIRIKVNSPRPEEFVILDSKTIDI